MVCCKASSASARASVELSGCAIGCEISRAISRLFSRLSAKFSRFSVSFRGFFAVSRAMPCEISRGAQSLCAVCFALCAGLFAALCRSSSAPASVTIIAPPELCCFMPSGNSCAHNCKVRLLRCSSAASSRKLCCPSGCMVSPPRIHRKQSGLPAAENWSSSVPDPPCLAFIRPCRASVAGCSFPLRVCAYPPTRCKVFATA